MTVNLYELPTDGVQLKDCGGNLQSGMESCVSFAPLPGATDAYLIGDTKPESNGATLRFTGDEIRSFVERWTRDANAIT
ncbi:DUF397 domain-containing protein [Paractinoplanes rishiriensis]|uniref:DUF397 domain-containing protein n=1 Tax=Paractinoplanes rishiriensis TaxID=1050105 RepID=A0A919JSL1_9ACTN|nr:DUF397 domain-containing protein [Actinoplanes rishiriensis]GIE94065.1 hypothetical protein Ari01nite_15300 [Actinoplanes rishiriensis]